MFFVFAYGVATVGGLALLLVGFAWGFPGPEWGYSAWARGPGLILFVAAIPAAALAMASVRILDKGESQVDGTTRDPPRRSVILWLGVPAWLSLAGAYASLGLDLAGPGRGVGFATPALSVPMLSGALFSIGLATIILREARNRN